MLQNKNIKKVFFCSAYNDVSHILAFIEEERMVENLIIVSNLQQCYKFIETLNIPDTELIFIKSKLISLKNPIYWFKERKNIKQIKKDILLQIKNADIIFFASFYDLLTCKCVDILKQQNKVFLSIPIEDDFVPYSRSTLKDKLLSILYNIRFQSFKRFKNQVVGLPLPYVQEHFILNRHVTEEMLILARKKYSYKIEKNSNSFILFLDSSDSYDKFIDNYIHDILTLFDFLTNFNTYVKGHPRLGLSTIVRNYNFKKIDSSIPIEFIDFSKCKCVIGIESIALANIANQGVKAISLLNYFDFKDSGNRNGWINYLERYCTTTIHYPRSMKEIEEQIISD